LVAQYRLLAALAALAATFPFAVARALAWQAAMLSWLLATALARRKAALSRWLLVLDVDPAPAVA
jgi:hypothetical protein